MSPRIALVALAFGLAALLPAGAQTALRVGVIPVTGAAPIFVANGEGLLKAAKLAPAFTTFESGPAMIQALASGTIDVYVAGVAPLAVARSKGIDVKVVLATAIEELVFVANPKLAPSFAPGVAPAAAFHDFKSRTGKPARLATQPLGSVPNTVLQNWLWQVAKADRGDVEIVAMGIDATQQAVLTGAVDGASIREPALTIVQNRNPEIRLIATGGQMFTDQPGTVVGVTGAFAAAHPAEVQGLVDALVRATAILQADPGRAAPFVEAALGKGITDVATIKAALSSPASHFVADPAVIAGATAKLQAFQVTIGALDKEGSIAGLFDRHFYEAAPK